MEGGNDEDFNIYGKQLAEEENNLNKLVGDIFTVGSKFTNVVDDDELERELRLLETSDGIDSTDDINFDDNNDSDQELLELEALVKNEAVIDKKNSSNNINVEKQEEQEKLQLSEVSIEPEIEATREPSILNIKPPSGSIEDAMKTAIKFRDEQQVEQARMWLVYAAILRGEVG